MVDDICWLSRRPPDDNICILVRVVWFGCAPQPSAAGECMIDVPMVHVLMWERRLRILKRGRGDFA